MKKTIVACVAALMLAVTAQAMAASVSLTPSASTAEVGQPFDIAVNATLEAWENITTLDFDITYDPTLLSFDPDNGMIPGAAWGANDFDSFDWGAGTANMFGSTFETDLAWQNASGGFEIATFTFDVLSTGKIELAFGFNEFYNDLELISGEDLELAGAEVNAVPIPGAVWLLGSGLLGLIGLRRKNK